MTAKDTPYRPLGVFRRFLRLTIEGRPEKLPCEGWFKGSSIFPVSPPPPRYDHRGGLAGRRGQKLQTGQEPALCAGGLPGEKSEQKTGAAARGLIYRSCHAGRAHP